MKIFKKIPNQKIKGSGAVAMAEILIIIFSIALVIFIFSLIRRQPTEPSSQPPPAELAGIPEENIKKIEEEIAEKVEKFPL